MRMSASRAALLGIHITSVKLDGKEVGSRCHYFDTDLGMVKLIDCDLRGRPICFRPFPGAPPSVSLTSHYGKVEVTVRPENSKPAVVQVETPLSVDRFPSPENEIPHKEIADPKPLADLM